MDQEEYNKKRHHSLWDYNILQKIGQGQTGTVYKVSHRITNHVYALKKISLSNFSETQRAELYHQTKQLQQIDHPHIIKYYESYLTLDNLYIISEFADKGSVINHITLRKTLKKRYRDQQLLEIFQILASAVKALHSKKIIHRNIKLSNIFIDKNNILKLGDLGLSKLLNNNSINPSYRIGSFIYYAPQLIQHQQYSYQIDIWALGCVFYNFVNLSHPFQNATLQTLAYVVLQKGPKPLKFQYNTGIVKLIFDMLHKNPNSRPNIIKIIAMIKQASKKGCIDKVNVYNRNIINSLQQPFAFRKLKSASSNNRSRKMEQTAKYMKISTNIIQNKSLNYSIQIPDNPQKIIQPKIQDLLKRAMNKKFGDIQISKTSRKMSQSKLDYYFQTVTPINTSRTIIRSSGFSKQISETTRQLQTQRITSQGSQKRTVFI